MARLNVYIPDDLKARMDAVGDAFNWSEIARPAINAALAAYEHHKEQNMTTAIERLRASKQQAQQADQTEGHEHGRTWAANDAEYAELKRLSAVKFMNEGAEFDALWKAVGPQMSESEVRGWCFDDEDAEPSDEYVRAFIEGAQEFFSEVRSKL